MKYNLMVRSRPSKPIAEKHEAFMALLAGQKNEWGLARSDWPAAAEPGTLPRRFVNLSKHLAKGIRGGVAYQNRKHLRDEAMFDDYFTLEFDPSRFDFHSLIEDAFPNYLEWFDAYFGEIGAEELTLQRNPDFQ